MNQHQTRRLCARIQAAIELPLAASLLIQQQQSVAASLDELKLIKLKVHLESAVRLVREQVGVRSLSGLLQHQTLERLSLGSSTEGLLSNLKLTIFLVVFDFSVLTSC